MGPLVGRDLGIAMRHGQSLAKQLKFHRAVRDVGRWPEPGNVILLEQPGKLGSGGAFRLACVSRAQVPGQRQRIDIDLLQGKRLVGRENCREPDRRDAALARRRRWRQQLRGGIEPALNA